ncbi:MAG: hypothetical protein K2O74_00195, partial [Eubacteriales bacterium]|nr:hypothetical protein [Eubacteriales bacterium]
AGVVAGTVASTLLTNFWVEPFVFFRYGVQEGWKRKLARYYARYAAHAAVLAADGVVLWALCSRLPVRNLAGWVLRGLFCTALYALSVLLAFRRRHEWRYLWGKGLEQLEMLKARLKSIFQ